MDDASGRHWLLNGSSGWNAPLQRKDMTKEVNETVYCFIPKSKVGDMKPTPENIYNVAAEHGYIFDKESLVDNLVRNYNNYKFPESGEFRMWEIEKPKQKYYTFICVSDDNIYAVEGVLPHTDKKDAYEHMRNTALEKMKWNTEWCDFDGDTQTVEYEVEFKPDEIYHRSHSGGYLYRIVECNSRGVVINAKNERSRLYNDCRHYRD